MTWNAGTSKVIHYRPILKKWGLTSSSGKQHVRSRRVRQHVANRCKTVHYSEQVSMGCSWHDLGLQLSHCCGWRVAREQWDRSWRILCQSRYLVSRTLRVTHLREGPKIDLEILKVLD